MSARLCEMDSDDAKQKPGDLVRADVSVRAPLPNPAAAHSQGDYIKQVVEAKKRWHHELTEEEKKRGFKGWHSRGYLPHFDAPGLRQFITFRLADSIPQELKGRWREILQVTDEREKFRRLERELDRGHGSCHLRNKAIATVVEETLLVHNGDAYQLLAWVIMPNHVHVLADVFEPLSKVVKSWKAYTAARGNEVLHQTGKLFWQAEYFDRYIRDDDQFRRVVRYIENNPVKAGLVGTPEAWAWTSAKYRGRFGCDEPLPLPNPKHAVRADVSVRAKNS